jgi:hypothetical protein
MKYKDVAREFGVCAVRIFRPFPFIVSWADISPAVWQHKFALLVPHRVKQFGVVLFCRK